MLPGGLGVMRLGRVSSGTTVSPAKVEATLPEVAPVLTSRSRAALAEPRCDSMVSKKPRKTLTVGKRITIDPRVMLGKPVIRGTRITVECILEKLAADVSIAEILSDYPKLARADVLAAVAFAHDVLATEDLLPSRDAS
jgi:uncharacterized protein (DUF433 family)